MAERQVLQGLRRYDLSDVFRAKHPYGHKGFNSAKEFSYYTNNRGNRIGRRFDHIFASHLLEVVECEYLQELWEVKRPRANRSALCTESVYPAHSARLML